MQGIWFKFRKALVTKYIPPKFVTIELSVLIVGKSATFNQYLVAMLWRHQILVYTVTLNKVARPCSSTLAWPKQKTRISMDYNVRASFDVIWSNCEFSFIKVSILDRYSKKPLCAEIDLVTWCTVFKQSVEKHKPCLDFIFSWCTFTIFQFFLNFQTNYWFWFKENTTTKYLYKWKNLPKYQVKLKGFSPPPPPPLPPLTG